MIYPEKILSLEATEQHFDYLRLHSGFSDRRSRAQEGLRRVKANSSAEEEIAAAEKRWSDVEAEFAAVYGPFVATRTLRGCCETFLREQGKAVPQAPAKPVGIPPRLVIAQPVDEENRQLAIVREKIAAQKDKRAQVAGAPPPAKTLIAEKYLEIDAVLDQICDPKKSLVYVEPALLLLAANAKSLKETISAHIERTVGKNGLAADVKFAQLAEIDASIFGLECEEERICLRIEAAGEHAQRRADFPPEIFFAIEAAVDSIAGAVGQNADMSSALLSSAAGN